MDLSTQPLPALLQPSVSAGAFFNLDFPNHTNMAAWRHNLAADSLPFYCSRRPEVQAHPVDDVRSRLFNSVYLNHAPRMVIRPKAIRPPFMGGYTDQKSSDIDFLRSSPFSRTCPRYTPFTSKTLLSRGEALRLCSLPANFAEELSSRTLTGALRVPVSPAANSKVFTVDASYESAPFAENTEKESQVTKRHTSLDFDNFLFLQQKQQQHPSQQRQQFALDTGISLPITLCKAKSDIDLSKEDVSKNECKDERQYDVVRKSDEHSGDTNGLKVREINMYSTNSSSRLEKLNQSNVQGVSHRKVIDRRTFSYKSRKTNKSFKNRRISPSFRTRGSKIRNSSNKIRTSFLTSHNKPKGEMYDNTPTTLCKRTENRNRPKDGALPPKDNENVWGDNDFKLLPPQSQGQATTVSKSDPGENTATLSTLGSKPRTNPSDTRDDKPLSVPFSLRLSCLGGDRKSFCCPQCRYLTDRKNNLKRHIVTMHQESGKILECCGVAFQSKAALRDHNAIFHRGGYRCQICSRNFCRKALLRRHLTVHSGQKDFFCDLCGYATSHKSNLERHQKVHSKRERTLVLVDPERPFKNVHRTSRDPSRSNNSSNSTYRSNGNQHGCNGNNIKNSTNNNNNNNNNNNDNQSRDNIDNNYGNSSNNINCKTDGLNIFAQVNFNNNLLLGPQDFSTAELFPTLADYEQEDHIATAASQSPNELENQGIQNDVRSNEALLPENDRTPLSIHRYRPRKGGMLRSRLAETYTDNDWFVKRNMDKDVKSSIDNDAIIPKVEQSHSKSESVTFTKLPQSEEEKCVAILEEREKGSNTMPDVVDDQNQEPNISKLKGETNEIQKETLKSMKRKRLCPLAYECPTCNRKFQCQVTLESHECQRLLCDSSVSISLVTSVRRGALGGLQ